MKILVTGNAGFIGFHVARRLIERGDSVVGFDVVNDYYDPALKEARLAELDEFVTALPSGYETMVGERGVRLSGGQRQRIGIARALYKKSSILILDEATSALDDSTEASVIQAVQRLGREYTVIMVAHRVTTLRECDTIYRLETGRLLQCGTYEDVLGPSPAMMPQTLRS